MESADQQQPSMPKCTQTDKPSPLCVDCIHHRYMKDIGKHDCTRNRGITNLVTGHVISIDCFAERYSSQPAACGQEGKFFQRRIHDASK